jgi:hypothetical protein
MAYDLEGAHRVAHEAAERAAEEALEEAAKTARGAPHVRVRIISRAGKRAYDEKYRKVERAFREGSRREATSHPVH